VNGGKKSNLLLWVATTLEILSRGRGTKKVKNRCYSRMGSDPVNSVATVLEE